MTTGISSPADAGLPTTAFGPDGTFTAAALARASIDTSTTASLTVTTAGGDRVTLLAQSSAHVGYAGLTYQAAYPAAYQAAAGGQRLAVQASAGEVDVTRGVAVTVDGSLDAHEQADVRRLASLLGKVADRLAKGDVGGALAAVTHTGGLATVAGFDMSVVEQQSVAVSQAATVQTTGASAVPEAPGDDAALADLVGRLVRLVRQSHAEPDDLARRVARLLRDAAANDGAQGEAAASTSNSSA